MPSLSSILLAFLLNVLQFALSINAKGGGGGKSTGKGTGKSTGKGTGKGTKGSGGSDSTPIYRSGSHCYDSPSHDHEIPCFSADIIVSFIFGGIAAIYLVVLIIVYLARKCGGRNPKATALKATKDPSTDTESTVPLKAPA